MQEKMKKWTKELVEVEQQIKGNEVHLLESNAIRAVGLRKLQGETEPISVLSGGT